MCNPRRIRVTVTNRIEANWERVVRRSVELCTSVSGEARLRQPLGDSVGGPALAMLDMLLSNGHPDWVEDGDGYRCSVEGGWIVYRPGDRSLEIVAALTDEISASGEAEECLSGTAEGEVVVEGEGMYYDDGWGGRSEEDARRDAEAAARGNLDQASRDLVAQRQQEAEAAAASSIEQAARERARGALERDAQTRRAELQAQARVRLDAVGVACRRRFHQLLGEAYRDAILAYARANGADGVDCREDGESVEIEFLVRR